MEQKFNKIIRALKMTLKPVFAGFVFVLLIPFSNIFAETFTVNNLSGLQTALNTAAANSESDTIIVTGGVYNVVTAITFWSDEEHSVMIKGEGTPVFRGNDTVRIMELVTVSNDGSIYVEGVRIEHGRADYGGGLYVETESADINISNCTITDNTAGNVCGGINIYSQSGNIRITNCSFLRNSSPNTSGYPFGTAGGLFVQTEESGTEINVEDCYFEDNTAQRDGAGAMLYPMGNSSSVIVRNNTFINNSAKEFGGGCWIRCPAGNASVVYKSNTLTKNSASEAGGGGGTYIEIESGGIDLSDNMLAENSSAWEGGGLWISNNGGTLEIRNNTFSKNNSDKNGGGANIFLDSGTATIDHNIFTENIVSESGGGLCLSTTTGNLNIFNNTFYSNNAGDGGDVYLYFDDASSGCSFYNNILYGSSEQSFSFSGDSTVTATYSDIESGTGQLWFGTGCIDSDPLFTDPGNGDFHLTWADFPVSNTFKSPCIDAGDPGSPLDQDNTTADIGVFYFDQSGTGVVEDISSAAEPAYLDKLYPNYPNPFNSDTKINYYIAEESNVKLSILDIRGNYIKTLVNGFQNSGIHSVFFRADNLPSGMYLIKLQRGTKCLNKKILLLK